MRAAELTVDYRLALFTTLMEEDPRLEGWDTVFQLLDEGQRSAQQAELPALAQRMEEGCELVLAGLRNSGRFLPWELQIMELGLATGSMATSYRRLRDYYVLQCHARQQLWQHCRLPLVICGAVLIAVWAYFSYAGLITPLVALMGTGLTTAALYALAKGLRRLLQQIGLEQLGGYWRRGLMQLPLFAPVNRARWRWCFFENLHQATAGGLALDRALALAARKLGDPSLVKQCREIAQGVAGGSKLSQALISSGLLKGVPMAAPSAGAGAMDAQQILVDATGRYYRDQLDWQARTLPLALYACLPALSMVAVLSTV